MKIKKALPFIITLAIIAGAFGAHMLSEKLSATSLKSYQTATHYLLIMSCVLLVLYYIPNFINTKNIERALKSIFIGNLLFSFSIYVLLLLKSMSLPYLFLVAITPLGGLLMILGWLWLGLEKLNSKS